MCCCSWTQNPVARHVACTADLNTISICQLQGHDELDAAMNYTIVSLPAVGLLHETSAGFREGHSEPAYAHDSIGPHELPFQLSDPAHRVVYIPPARTWPPEGYWASFSYVVTSMKQPENDPLVAGPPALPYPVTSEEGFVVFVGPRGSIAGSSFNDEDNKYMGWSVSGNAHGSGVVADGPRHHALVLGKLDRFLSASDQIQQLNPTGEPDDMVRWYFEASADFYTREMAVAYGGHFRFTMRSLTGNFSNLNSRLEWMVLECATCESGHGIRLVKLAELSQDAWDGSERRVSLNLHPRELWQRDPLNPVLDLEFATECEIAAVLTNLSRIAILGDYTRTGETVAIDDVEVVVDAASQPSYPVVCQRGCSCKRFIGTTHPTCCS